MKRLRGLLVLLATGVLLLAAAFVSLRAAGHFESSLSREQSAVEREIGRTIIEVIEKAVDSGIPFDRFAGVESYLETVKRENKGVAYLVVSDMTGRIRYGTSLAGIRQRPQFERSIADWSRFEFFGRIGGYFNTAVPVNYEGRQIAWLHVGSRANIVEQLLQEIAFDIVTVLIVSVLVAFELLRLLLTVSFSMPLRALQNFLSGISLGDFQRYLPRDFIGGIGRVNSHINAIVGDLNRRADHLRQAGKKLPEGFSFHAPRERKTLAVSDVDIIRWPFFLMIFADALSLSFFPVYVSQFYDPSFPLPRQVVVGLPISVFMLVWAIAMPWAGAWCDRVGYKQAFGFGAAVTTLGLVLTAQAGSMAELLLWRSITAVGYGTVFITTQTFITNNTEPKARTRAMGLFLATFFAGSLSGAAIGGILVDRLGYRMTFILSGLLSAAAVLFVLRFLAYDRSSLSVKKGLELADFRNLLSNKQFAAITFLAAIPSKIALTGFLYFSIPLYLKLLGHNQSVTGRVMMGYGLAMVLLAPVIATLADRFENRWRFVMIGGYAGAIAMAAPYFLDDIFGVLLSVTFLGIAHAVGVSSQLTLIGDRCQETVKQVGQATATGIFRMTERAGNVLGPLILGGMIAVFDFKGAFVGVALFTAATTTFFLLLLLWFDRRTTRVKSA